MIKLYGVLPSKDKTPFLRLFSFQKIFLYSSVEFMRCIVTHVSLSVVDCGSLYDNGKITSRSYRNRMTRYPYSKVLCKLVFKAEPVVFFVFVPLSEFYYKTDFIMLFYGFNTKQRFYIYYSDTAKLNKMFCDLMCRTDKRNIRNFTNLDYVVRYQTVSTFDKLKSCLAFTDSAVSRYKNTLAENVDKNSVN